MLKIADLRARVTYVTGLDDLSKYMKEERYVGQTILFSLILLTTFRMCLLYSFTPIV